MKCPISSDHVFVRIAECLQVFVRARVCRDGDEPVGASGFAVFGLVSFDHAQQSRLHEAAGKCRLVHQDEHVKRIAIAAASLRDEPEIVGKYGACR